MIGMGGQFMQHRIDKEAVAKYIPGDPLLDGPGSVFAGDASAGVYFKSSTLNLGVSVKQLIQSKLDFIKTATNIEGRLYRHYYFMGSYNWKTDESNVLIPNMLVKFAGNAPLDIECGVQLEHKDLFWVGLNYHHKQSFSGFAGVKLDHKFSIGYSYDQFVTPLSIFDDRGNSHEISFRYFFIQ
jgi:type IX secretion system PorP/SprF family membrane protein